MQGYTTELRKEDSKVHGESYETMLQQRVFTPLDMQHSTTVRTKVEELLVDGLAKKGNIATNWDFDALKGPGRYSLQPKIWRSLAGHTLI